MGDHYDYHAMCVHHQRRVPGLTILHDYILHHALYRYSSIEGEVDSTYRAHLAAECGADAIRELDRTISSHGEREWWDRRIADFPLFRWALQNTCGVVTHAEFYRHQVEYRLGCPTQMIPLAYDATWTARKNTQVGDDQRYTILTLGTVNPNKRYHAVLQALSASPLLRSSCRYRIVGPVEPQQREDLERFLSGLNPRPDVTFTGRVSESELEAELGAAHIISCLRYPALEGGSASVIEGLLTGKPVIVCDTGCYREIPEDLVYKIDPHHEVSELTAHLEQIVRRYPRALVRARDAAKWARNRHSASAYAQTIVRFAQQLLQNRPIMRVADQIATHLQSWQIAPDGIFCERIDRAMEDLFGRPRSTDVRRRAA